MICSITIAGTPGRKNRRHLVVPGGKFSRMVNSPEFKSFVIAVEAAWAKAGYKRIFWGLWRLRLHAVWPRTRHLDVPTACGDVDAPVSWVLDALQQGGALDDDMRIVELQCTKAQGPDARVEITLELLEQQDPEPKPEVLDVTEDVTPTRGQAAKGQPRRPRTPPKR